MSAVTQELSTFASRLALADVPDPVVDRAILALRDLLGIALSESSSAVTDKLLHVARRSAGQGPCVLPGRGERLSPFWAAAVMGTSTHHAELDDGHRGGHVHPGVTTVPALLMDAQVRESDGEDLLAGLIASYELAIRIGEAISPDAQYDRGFHIPGLVGMLSASAAVARLRRMAPDQTAQVMGCAVLGPITPFLAFSAGRPVKDFYGGWPAAMAILAADLTAAGLGGPHDLLDAPMGWFDVVGAGREAAGRSLEVLGERWRILETYVKVHAACSFSHSPIDAALDLHDPTTPTADIVGVTVATHVFADRLDERRPSTPQGARFSIPWVVAAALARGRVGPNETEPGALQDPELLGLAARVDVVEDTHATRQHLTDDTVRPARVSVRYADGTERVAERTVARGGPENPLSEEEVYARFMSLNEAIKAEKLQKVWDACGNLRADGGLGGLVQALEATGRDITASR
ncbi:MmgE/PrpD family protein [Ornithinimicrobium kibberense]|uniref:MmgE/PrpD family protein n=1 Tax=Ornithinimicrobium kibberense TaxID=282060 RepID=A0ABV5V5V2_9MICO|nr:MmgE/PrpD family protein [Ornithinimicrobium kibberense]